VQELFENVLSEEMKELYRKVQEMMEKLDKDKLQEQLARDEDGPGGHREGAGPCAGDSSSDGGGAEGEDIAKQLEESGAEAGRTGRERPRRQGRSGGAEEASRRS
jgi:hypothetical protein